MHRAGDFFNRGGSLDADLCGFVGRAGNLIGACGNLAGRIARGADEFLQAVGHAKKRVAERVALRAGHDFDGQIAFGDGHRNAGHLLQVRDHIVEGSRQRTDFVVAMNVDVLIEIAGIADLARDGNEVSQRLGDRLGRVVGHAKSPTAGRGACHRS